MNQDKNSNLIIQKQTEKKKEKKKKKEENIASQTCHTNEGVQTGHEQNQKLIQQQNYALGVRVNIKQWAL